MAPALASASASASAAAAAVDTTCTLWTACARGSRSLSFILVYSRLLFVAGVECLASGRRAPLSVAGVFI